MGETLRDPLIRGILLLIALILGVLLVMVVVDLYLSITEGKLVISGVTTISDIFGYIIGGAFALGWGLLFPMYFVIRGRRRYVPSEIAEAIDMYYRGLITRDQLVQIIDRYRQ